MNKCEHVHVYFGSSIATTRGEGPTWCVDCGAFRQSDKNEWMSCKGKAMTYEEHFRNISDHIFPEEKKL